LYSGHSRHDTTDQITAADRGREIRTNVLFAIWFRLSVRFATMIAASTKIGFAVK